MSTEEQPQQQEQQPQVEEKIIEEKVFFGNVDFNLTEEELKDFLKDYEVESVEVPKKKIRKRGESIEAGAGYAFALFKTVDEAKKAIEELNDKEFKGRKVYTKQALPDSLKPKKQPSVKKTQPKKSKKKSTAAATTDAAAASTDAAATSDAKEDGEENKENAIKKTNGSTRRKTKFNKVEKVPLSEGTESKDTIFVNNLDFNVTEEQLKDYFKELEPTWVDVPRRTLSAHVYRTLKRQNVPIRGRGIGFVRFADESKQKEAVEKFNGKELNGRTITVSIAIDSNVKPEENEVEN